ncbi:hypothetical protein RJ55_00767 [Drechmeria coniospora]|nr:hypothetical protein RJ55_00767 [Drechmeria coniospora]
MAGVAPKVPSGIGCSAATDDGRGSQMPSDAPGRGRAGRVQSARSRRRERANHSVVGSKSRPTTPIRPGPLGQGRRVTATPLPVTVESPSSPGHVMIKADIDDDASHSARAPGGTDAGVSSRRREAK